MSGVFVVASKYILGMTKINTKTKIITKTKINTNTKINTKTDTVAITKTKTGAMTIFQCFRHVEESSGLFNAVA